jgi:hypothetical protein
MAYDFTLELDRGESLDKPFDLQNADGTAMDLSGGPEIRLYWYLGSAAQTALTLKNTAAGGGDTQISVSGSRVTAHLTPTSTATAGSYQLRLEVLWSAAVPPVERVWLGSLVVRGP